MSRESDLGWAAGLLDGEGCILVTYQKKGVQGQPRYILQVMVSNTHLPMLEKFKEIVGIGGIYLNHHRPGTKPCFMWIVTAAKAEQSLRLLRSYLVGKAEQADIGIASRAYVGKRGITRRHGGAPLARGPLDAMRLRLTELKQQQFKMAAL